MVLMHKLPLAIVTVISITSATPVTESVGYLKSPLAATGRNHTCQGEPQVFICQVDGLFIRWIFDSNYRATLFHDHSVNTVRTVSGQYGIRAVLIGNDAIPGNAQTVTRRLKSALIVESTSVLNGDVHNISCSSDTAAMQRHQVHVAEIPNKPTNVRVSPVHHATHSEVPKQTHHTLSVTWDAPNNIDQFDLESYKVFGSITHQETGIQYNSTYKSDINHGHVFIIPHNHTVHITVKAISKCSHESIESNPAIWGVSDTEQLPFASPTKMPTLNKFKPSVADSNYQISGFKDLLPYTGSMILSAVLEYVLVLSNSCP